MFPYSGTELFEDQRVLQHMDTPRLSKSTIYNRQPFIFGCKILRSEFCYRTFPLRGVHTPFKYPRPTIKPQPEGTFQ